MQNMIKYSLRRQKLCFCLHCDAIISLNFHFVNHFMINYCFIQNVRPIKKGTAFRSLNVGGYQQGGVSCISGTQTSVSGAISNLNNQYSFIIIIHQKVQKVKHYFIFISLPL